MAGKCRFCNKIVDDPCNSAGDAAMRCEVNAVVHLQQPNQLTEQNRLPYDDPMPTHPGIPADIHPNRYEMAPSETKVTFSPGAPTVSMPLGYTEAYAGKTPFAFDESVLMLLMEAQLELGKKASLKTLWNRAKELSEGYEIIMKPTLKRRGE